MGDPVSIGAAVGWGICISAVGWVVSPIITKLLNKGFSYLAFDGSGKLKELETKVLQLELLMEAVEESPCRDQLEKLLENLKYAFYEAEDILDAVEYYHLERQVSQSIDKLDSQSVPSSRSNWVKKFHSALPKRSRLKRQVSGTTSDDPPPSMSKMELKKILKKIENIVTEAHKILQLLNLPGRIDVDNRRTVASNSRGVVTTIAPPPVVIGRDSHRDKVIAILHQTGDDGQLEHTLSYSIIGIHGIAGSGKSTLAQYVCAKEEDADHFDIVIWVHVSQNFSLHTILREMIEQVTGKPSPNFNGGTALQKKLKEELCGKRFLLVLDDVWHSKDVNQQESLQQIVSSLNVGVAGSMVLATSRTLDALLALGAVRCIPIPDLDDDVFLKLFMHYALGIANIDERDQRKFEMIGSEIAKKLKRSPLAAKTVAAQLRIRPNIEFWRNARDRDLLNETMGALWWSYQHLNEQVRRCFSYCSIFPRRYRLDPFDLVKLWVAEGFVTSSNTGKELEAIGQGYFDELVSASFLQLVDDGKGYYTIHDLLHDLIEKVARSDCFRADNGWKGEFPQDIRHLSVENCNLEMITNKIIKLENLRTLIIYTDENDTALEEKAFDNMFKSLTKLRVLQIIVWRTEAFSFPASIGQLKHLRYLAFLRRHRYKTMMFLPITISKLYHLQLLQCVFIRFSSSEHIAKLISLRHLLCIGSLDVPNIGRLVSLQTFRSFRVKKEPGYELQQLKHLNLGNKLGIHGLENVGSKGEALEANLAAKERLTNLTLGWDSDGLQRCSADLQSEILEGLHPPVHLDILQLWCYNGSRCPDWIVGVQGLLLWECSQLEAIPEQHEFCHLNQLQINTCTWDALPDNMEHLTSLQTLFIEECKNLRSLPTLPQSLLHFELSDCDSEFMKSCQMVGDPNWEKIQHVPTIIIGLESTPPGAMPCDSLMFQ